jgi:hypothetical protein
MARYASNTAVSSEKSRNEIRRILMRYGADQFIDGENRQGATIGFAFEGRGIRFVLPMPDRNSPEFTRTPGRGRPRRSDAAEREYEQAIRQRWRALALVIKAKLEAIDAGITSFDEEFLAHMVLPGGQTVGQNVLPMIDEMRQTGRKVPLLEFKG